MIEQIPQLGGEKLLSYLLVSLIENPHFVLYIVLTSRLLDQGMDSYIP
jgi:hypothetical protein